MQEYFSHFVVARVARIIEDFRIRLGNCICRASMLLFGRIRLHVINRCNFFIQQCESILYLYQGSQPLYFDEKRKKRKSFSRFVHSFFRFSRFACEKNPHNRLFGSKIVFLFSVSIAHKRERKNREIKCVSKNPSRPPPPPFPTR